jgi:hypothetical protein
VNGVCHFELRELSMNQSCKVLPRAFGLVVVDFLDVGLPMAEVDAVVVVAINKSKELGVDGFVPLWRPS